MDNSTLYDYKTFSSFWKIVRFLKVERLLIYTVFVDDWSVSAILGKLKQNLLLPKMVNHRRSIFLLGLFLLSQ